MLYIVVGQWRLPWGFQIYRGKDTPSPTELGLRLLRQLPKILTQRFEVLVLADTAFGSNDFVTKGNYSGCRAGKRGVSIKTSLSALSTLIRCFLRVEM